MPRRTVFPLAVLVFAAVLPLQGCFLPFFQPKVTTEDDRSAPLVRQTYSWGRVHMETPLYEPTVRAAVDKDLQARGWQLVPSGGSVAVYATGDIRSEAQLESIYGKQGPAWAAGQWGAHGLGPGWKPFYGEATNVALSTAESHLVVDFFDAQNHRLLFRGVAPDRLSGSRKQNTQGLEKALKLMFKKFPPKS